MVFPYKIVDLTHVLDDHIPTWGGNCGFSLEVIVDYADCQSDVKFCVMKMSMYAGIGTHIDAPSHCKPGGKCIHELSAEELCMPCIVIDVSAKVHERYSVSLEDIASFEQVYGLIPKDSCVMIRTGWEKFWDKPELYRNNYLFPSISFDAANLLIQRGVYVLGIDTLSADRPEDGFKVHKVFLGSDKILIENVANLAKMPSIGSYVMIMPIKLKDATESPVRLIGLI